jgi:hypothetical protein
MEAGAGGFNICDFSASNLRGISTRTSRIRFSLWQVTLADVPLVIAAWPRGSIRSFGIAPSLQRFAESDRESSKPSEVQFEGVFARGML